VSGWGGTLVQERGEEKMARRDEQRGMGDRRKGTWGGRRAGAGRKPKSGRAGVPHRTRERLSGRHPVHVTMRVRREVWNLRSRRAYRVIERALSRGADRFGMRLTHHSVQGNHLHLIVEAKDARALSRGMQGLSIRVAQGLNRLMKRKGKVLEERFHSHVLWTPREVRNAIRYVLDNARLHALRNGRAAADMVDGLASGPGLPGWLGVPPHTWLLRVGWLYHSSA